MLKEQVVIAKDVYKIRKNEKNILSFYLYRVGIKRWLSWLDNIYEFDENYSRDFRLSFETMKFACWSQNNWSTKSTWDIFYIFYKWRYTLLLNDTISLFKEIHW